MDGEPPPSLRREKKLAWTSRLFVRIASDLRTHMS